MVLQTTQPVFLLPMCCCSPYFKVFHVYFHIVLTVLFSYLLARSPGSGDRRVYSKVASGAFDWPFESVSFAFAVAAVPVPWAASSLALPSERASERAGPRSFLNYRRRVDPLCHAQPSMQGGLEQRRQTQRQRGLGGWGEVAEEGAEFYLFLSRGRCGPSAFVWHCTQSFRLQSYSCTRVVLHCFGTGQWHIRGQSSDVMGGGGGVVGGGDGET